MDVESSYVRLEKVDVECVGEILAAVCVAGQLDVEFGFAGFVDGAWLVREQD